MKLSGFAMNGDIMRKLLFIVMALLAGCAWGQGVVTDTMTVADGGDYYEKLPFYTYYLDGGQGMVNRSQSIYPAGMLAGMGKVTRLRYYGDEFSFNLSRTVLVKMGETADASFDEDSPAYIEGLRTYYSGNIEIVDGRMEVVLDSAYSYNGGNLVIEFLCSGSTNSGTINDFFIGEEVYGAARSCSQYYNYQPSVHDFLPKVTFTYEHSMPVQVCNNAENLTAEERETGRVDLRWSAEGVSYRIVVSQVQMTEAMLDTADAMSVTDTTAEIGGLEPATQYYFYVKVVCDQDAESGWEETSLVTACPAPQAVTAEGGDGSMTVRVTGGEGESYKCQYWREGERDTVTVMILGDSMTVSGLERGTYACRVQRECGGGRVSGWIYGDAADVYEHVDVLESDTVCYGQTEYTVRGETFAIAPGLNRFSITRRDSVLLGDTCWHYSVYEREHPMAEEFADTISVDPRQPYSYTEHGFSLSSPVSGDYSMTYERMGCDSTVTLHLRVAYAAEESATICSNESYVWEGHGETAYTEAGRYAFSFTTAAGMDSVWTLVLTVNQAYALDFDTTMCSGDVIEWEGEMITAAGDYVAAKETVMGCDSVLTLHVTVRDTVAEHIAMTFCQNELDIEHAGWEPGIYQYTDTAVAQNGCDSFTHYTIVVSQTYDTMEFATAYLGDTVEWHGYKIACEKLGQEVYCDSLKSAEGCDSVTYLALKVFPKESVENVDLTPMRIAPNPVASGGKTYLDRQWSTEEMDGMMVEIVDNTGRVTERFEVTDYPIEIEAAMPGGIYHVRVVTGDGKVLVEKMAVE